MYRTSKPMYYRNLPQSFMSPYSSSSLFHDTRKEDIYNLMELLITSNDINVQIKFLSVLGAYTMSNGTYAEIIITYKPLYYKILDILNSGQSMCTARILNFFTVLLTYDLYNANNKSLTVFADNMIRVSGCLATMSDMFINCMMDTWVALCHCLAEACRGCRTNQDYCSHLVPVCVKKCNQDNIEVLLVLNSLLRDHETNVKLFLLNNGATIFTRPMLQQDTCMQLLNTVIKNPEAKDILRESNIIDHLHYFIKSHGQHSRIGQWSMVILYHLNSQSNGPQSSFLKSSIPQSSIKSIIRSDVPSADISEIRLKDDAFNTNDTTRLFQNIIKEIGNWKSTKEDYFKKPLTTCNTAVYPNYTKRNSSVSTGKNNINSGVNRNDQSVTGFKDSKLCHSISRTSITNKFGNTDLSFSIILKGENDDANLKNKSSYNNVVQKQFVEEPTRDTKLEKSRKDSTISASSHKDFKPQFTSTPNKKRPNRHSNSTSPSEIQRSTLANITKARKLKQNKQKKVKDFVKNEAKNTSLSSRFLSILNESCTTLVKSVKNIFRTKDKSPQPSLDTTVNTANDDGSNSFMEFMNKRDAARTRTTHFEEFSKDNLCQTCEDTRVLKSKLTSNKDLEETIKKLKLGINVYGCDFKKISRIIFAREHYMTPKILYSIYRKLIVK